MNDTHYTPLIPPITDDQIEVRHSRTTEIVHLQRGTSYLRRHTMAIARIDGLVITAQAICNPNDQFSRKIGRQIACGRLRKAYENWFKYSDLPDHTSVHTYFGKDAVVAP